MRTLTLVALLFCSTSCIAQKTSGTPAIDEPIVYDSHHIDTVTQKIIGQILRLPTDLTVISCDIYVNSAGELFKFSWSKNEPGKWATVRAFMERSKPTDKISFANIYVVKGGKKIHLADKTVDTFSIY